MKRIFLYVISCYHGLSCYNGTHITMYRKDITNNDLYTTSIPLKGICNFNSYCSNFLKKYFTHNVEIIKQASYLYLQNIMQKLQKKLFSFFHENKTVHHIKKIILCFYTLKYHLIAGVFQCTFSWCVLQILCIGTLHLFHILQYITFFNNIENLSHIYLPYSAKLITPYHIKSIWLQKSFIINNLTACHVGMILACIGNIMWVIHVCSTCKNFLKKFNILVSKS